MFASVEELRGDGDGWETGDFIDREVGGENGLLLRPDIYGDEACAFRWDEENPKDIIWVPYFRY